MSRLADLYASSGLTPEDYAHRERMRLAMQQRHAQRIGGPVDFAPETIVASAQPSAHEIAFRGARRAGMADAASMVGAGAPSADREAMARHLAMQAAQRSGVADAAASVGAAPSRGQFIRARLAELRAGGMGARDAVIQAAREGLLPGPAAARMLAVPDTVQ